MFNHSRILLYYFIAVCASTLFGCNQSSLSTTSVTDLGLIGATIEIAQNPYDKSKNSLFLQLFDNGGDRISNDSLIIIFNNIETKVTHKKGLYYTDESYYRLENVPVSKTYKVEIKLSDGKTYLLGTADALQEENINSVACSETGDLNKDLIVKWRNLKEINELSISTSIRLNSTGDNITNYNYRPDITQKIYSSGNYVFSKYDYRDAKSIVSSIALNFSATKLGQINPILVSGSKITVSSNIEKSIIFENNKDQP